jgi:ferredoxin
MRDRDDSVKQRYKEKIKPEQMPKSCVRCGRCEELCPQCGTRLPPRPEVIQQRIEQKITSDHAKLEDAIVKYLADKSDTVGRPTSTEIIGALRNDFSSLDEVEFIQKLKGIPVPGRAIPFNITEKGLELSTTSRVV